MNELSPISKGILFFFLMNLAVNVQAQLYINECMAKNSTGITDENNGFDDWIEIYNAGSSPVDLAGYYMSDDPAQPTLWKIPPTNSSKTTVAAEGFLILWADKEITAGENHLDFKISGNGETILLYAADGTTLVDQITFGPQNDDVSFGRSMDGADTFQLFPVATPGASNNNPPPPTYPAVFAYPITDSTDDAEEQPGGFVKINSGDIELTTDGALQQVVGLRFNNIEIPQGATITNAWLQFYSSFETSSGPCDLFIHSELSDNAATFLSVTNNITSRPLTSTAVNWQPVDWNQADQNGPDQRSPNLSPLIQEVLANTNWTSGGSIAFIISGTGTRTAWSQDFNSGKEAQLIIELQLPAPNEPIVDLFLNEIASRGTDYADEAGDFEDWVELYNASSEAINIGGLFLTDDLTNPTKWQVNTSHTIPPNGYQIIWTDSDPEEGVFHTNFKLSGAGTMVALIQIIDNAPVIIDSITIGNIPFKATYGRETDSSNNWVTFGEITPDATNNGAALWLSPPVFSLAGGIYSNVQSLSLSHPLSNTDIRYTTDGSEPDINSTLYNGPISIGSNMPVKAKAFKTGYAESPSGLESYLIDIPVNLPILHLTTDPDHFFSDESGIYVVGTNGAAGFCSTELRNWAQPDWERPVNLTMYEEDGTQAFNVNVGVKIGGACSRNFAMKSLNVYFREKEYGDGNLNYPLFPGRNHDNYLRFKLRNSGQDFVRMGFRDGLVHTMLWDFIDLDLQAYRPAVLYINGEYWGVHNLRESLNDEYFETNYGIDKDELDLIKNPGLFWAEVKAGDQTNYLDLFSFFENNDLSQTANYNYAESQIDVNEFTNYWITMPYTANYDWPSNNVIVWRERVAGAKWRWAVLDTDASTGNGLTPQGDYDFNTLAQITDPNSQSWPNHQNSTLFFRKMLENTSFRNEYIQRSCSFMELVFPSERVAPMTDSIFNLLLPESDAHFNRWSGLDDVWGSNYWSWIGWVADFKEFFVERPNHFRNFMQAEFGLNGTYTLTMNYDADTKGDVFVNLNQMEVPYNYSGIYFNDIPLRVTAIAKPGFVFSHWLETGDSNPATDFTANNDTTLTPIFVPDVNDLTVDLGPDTTICLGNSHTIDASITNCSDCIYLWEDGSSNPIRVVSPAATMTYAITVTNSNNETATDEVTIVVNDKPVLSLDANDITCWDAADGSINLIVSGGSGNYTFIWSNQETTQNISNLYPGNYAVTVTDSLGCTNTNSAFINEPPELLFGQIDPEDVSCFGASDGAIDLVLGGGTEPYSYLWNTGATTEDLANIPGGNYSVTITEGNNCTTVAFYVVNEPEAIITSFETTPILCNTYTNSFITLDVEGGEPPFSFLWNTGETTEDIYNLGAGDYEVSITDNANCTYIESFTITEPNALDANETVIPVSCDGIDNGAIETNVQGGTTPYTYLWSNGDTTSDISNLTVGSYLLTVSDTNSCQSTFFFLVDVIDGLLIDADISPISCAGEEDAALSISVIGGSSPYQYLWATGDTSSTLSNLAPGTYEVSVIDNGTCEASQVFEIIGPDSLLATATNTPASCGEDIGSVTLATTGGTPPYDYLWSNGSTDQNLASLSGGDYTVTITDDHDCVFVLTQNVSATSAIEIISMVDSVTCVSGSDGNVLLQVAGGNGENTFVWNNGFDEPDLLNIPTGTYAVTVTDSDGCSGTHTVVVGQPLEIVEINTASEISCYGGSDGAIDLEVIIGSGPYSFLWSNGDTTEDIDGISAGIYQVSATDVNACVSVYTYQLDEPDTLVLTASIQDPGSNGNDGSITVTTAGGVEPYVYLWSNGATSQSITDLTNGDYTVTMTDGNGCAIIETYQLMTIGTNASFDDFDITVYPNPTDGVFIVRIVSDNAIEGNLSVYNVLGQSCYHDQISGLDGFWEVDLRGRAAGVYVVKLEVFGEVILRRVVVE